MPATQGGDAPPGTDEGGARAAILAATTRLIEHESLDELSVAQILDEAGISRATFYFYFASKDDAFAAVLADVIDTVLPGFETVMGDAQRRRTPALADDLAAWLAMGGARRSVLTNAIEEWPRRAELRAVHLQGIARMQAAVGAAIEEDRRSGAAPGGVAVDQLAAGLVWTLERAWYESLRGTRHLDDVDAVASALASTFAAAIYGHH